MKEEKKTRDLVQNDLQGVERQLVAVELQIMELEQQKKELERRREQLSVTHDGFYLSYEGLKVSEHAVLRYMERGLDVSMEAIIESMFKDTGLSEKIKITGSGLYPINDGCKARVVNNTVVTIIK